MNRNKCSRKQLSMKYQQKKLSAFIDLQIKTDDAKQTQKEKKETFWKTIITIARNT